MKATSQSPRLKVVDRKKSLASKRRSVLTVMDERDCQAFARAWSRANSGLEGRERISAVAIAKFAATMGGAKHDGVWSNYKNGTRRMPARDKIIAAMYLETTPEKLFGWELPAWCWPMLLQLMGQATARQQLLFSELLAGFAEIPQAQRQLALAKLRQFS